MKNLEGIEQQAQELEIKAMELRAAIKIMKAEKEKPEYPDGTPGWFFDSGNKWFGWLENNLGNDNEPFRLFAEPELKKSQCSWENFEPSVEAILPMPVEHGGGAYPGDPMDWVLVIYNNGDLQGGFANARGWCSVKSYWIIKRTEK